MFTVVLLIVQPDMLTPFSVLIYKVSQQMNRSV